MKARRTVVVWVTFVSISILAGPTVARAAWYLFTVSGPGNTPVAQVAEQIVPAQFNVNGGAALGLDYIYRVRNIGAKAIQGFSVYTGPGGAAMLLTYTGTPPATNPGFLQPFGPIGNASVPFLTGEGNTFSPVAWRFDEFDNRAPVSRYVTHWVAPAATPLTPGFWTEFDLFSGNPPVAGGGVVDPIGGPGDLGIDLVGGALVDPANEIFNASSAFDQQVQVQNNPDLSDPYIGTPQFGPGNQLVPEPSSVMLLASGVLVIGCIRSYRHRTSFTG